MCKDKPKAKAKKQAKAEAHGKEGNNHWRVIAKETSQALGNSGLLQLAIAIALILIGPAFGVIMQTHRAIIYGTATGLTVLIWIVAIVAASKAFPPETEFHGFLAPGNDPTPPNPCREPLPPEAIAVYMGSSVGYTTQNRPFVVLKLDQDIVCSIEHSGEGLILNATIRSPDKRIVATIERNEFHINSNNYFYIKRPDKHTLIVRDQQNRECLNVRFLNSKAVKCSESLNLRPPTFPLS